MADQSRLFQAGPDPFGRMWHVQFRWLQTGITIRHADTVDVKFDIAVDGDRSEEKVIALSHPDLLALCARRGRKLTDPYCLRMAAAHLKRMIETSEDMDKTLVTVRPEEMESYDSQFEGVTVPQRS